MRRLYWRRKNRVGEGRSSVRHGERGWGKSSFAAKDVRRTQIIKGKVVVRIESEMIRGRGISARFEYRLQT